MIDDQPLLNEYLSESDELLDSLLADLDQLAAITSGEPDAGLINRIFRAAHSLKGLSGMMGLVEVQTLAHQFEDLLDDVRLGYLKVTRGTSAALQEAGAGLAALVGSAARGTVRPEDFERLNELLAGISAQTKRNAREPGSSSLLLSKSEHSLLTDYEEHRIDENLKAGRFFYSIAAEIDAEVLEEQYRGLAAKLSDSGELITTLPGEKSPLGKVSLKLVFATTLRETEVRRLASSVKGRITRLDRSGWRKAGEKLRVVGRRRATEDRGVNAVLPPAFAGESLQQLSPNVRVEMNRIDELSGLAHELAIQGEKLASMAGKFLGAAGLGARERFELRFATRRLNRDFLDLEERLVALRMVSLAQTFTRAARLTGRLARELGKSVSVEVKGRETQLDKVIVDRVADSIYHLLRNAVDHGLETAEQRRLAGKSARGKITIEASLEGTRAVIAISDDGAGIDLEGVRKRAVEVGLIAESDQPSDEETLRLIFRPGFSTADHVSAVSGRGVGLDAVERTIHQLGGEVRVAFEPGKWTRFEIAVPTTLVMISAFLVRAGGWPYAINVDQIVELRYVSPEDVLGRDGKRSVVWEGANVPLIELKYLLGLGGARVLGPSRSSNGSNGASGAGASRLPILMARAGDRTVAVAVEVFDKRREIIVKSLGSIAGKIRGVSGGVDLEGGEVALVLDIPGLLIRRSLRS
jgi:two-component system chemotaxis sensor kinase CheA